VSRQPQLKVGIGWINVTVTGPVDVALTFKGYAPVLPVKVNKTGLDYLLYISARSLAEQLEPLRKKNIGSFAGLTFSIRKESDDKYAAYELKSE
jgi:hypothetical protein